MKCLYSLLLLIASASVVNALVDSAIVDQKFSEYKKNFRKTYKNSLAEFVGKFNFKNSLNFIEKHSQNQNFKFKVGINQFSDMDPEFLKNMTSVQMPNNEASLASRAIIFLDPVNFPPGPRAIDFRDTGCVTPVKDQSYYCFSCYAFSGIASLESQWCLKNNVSVTMSEQMIIDCTNGYNGNKGCAGGSQGPAYIYTQIVSFGIKSDATYPYEEFYSHVTPFACRFNKSRAVATTTGYFRIRTKNETEIVNIIAKVGPVSAAMNGEIPTFWYYSSGIYNDPTCLGSMSHSVLIVGYGTDDSYDPPVPYWICKNSWSTDWGDSGYFKIQRGVNLCGIAAFLIFPDVPTVNATTTTAAVSMTTTTPLAGALG